MSKIYSNPVRVYLILGAIALFGLASATRLPVSLFPNSTKPAVYVGIAYGNATAEEFLNTYGAVLEWNLKNLSTEDVQVDTLEARYDSRRVHYNLAFKWGTNPDKALKDTEIAVNSFAARLPQESRDSVTVWLDNENSGFFALALYSEKRSLNELYDLIEPILGPKMASVKDAQNPVLWNPSQQEISIELVPEAMAALGLFPRDVETAVTSAIAGRSGGFITLGPNQLQIEMPRQVQKIPNLGLIPIATPSGRLTHLSDVAHINLAPNTTLSKSFKTSGAPSLILFAKPKPGGNVKRMSEDLVSVVNEVAPQFPPDVKYRKLVDPSEFIRSAVRNVFTEVGVAALLAVGVLFLFIGSLRNVITAAIEIPLSMVLAFILMRFFGMNLNLISLAGLALSAGMNVDASVVVMENIFRHFEKHPGPHTVAERLRILTTAVNEVRFAVIASTISSLVVFLPLVFTSDLSYAILGDLAKAVVFSHGFSAVVALILVPTIRLQLMAVETGQARQSPVEKTLLKLEKRYGEALLGFIRQPIFKWAIYGGLFGLLALLVAIVLPRLPKEVIGTPDTDWMVLAVSTEGNTILKQMEVQSETVERQLIDKFGDKISYTFNQTYNVNHASIMARLKDKHDMKSLWKAMEAQFVNSPTTDYWVGPWNPSELPIPDPPHLRIAVRGKRPHERALVAREVRDLLESKHAFHRLWNSPSVSVEKAIVLKPHLEQWEALSKQGSRFSPGDIADVLRVATTGRQIGYFPTENNQMTELVLKFPPGLIDTPEAVGAFPVGVGSRLIPLKALVSADVKDAEPTIYREDLRDVYLISGRQNRGEESTKDAALKNTKQFLDEWRLSPQGREAEKLGVSVSSEDPAKDVNEAIAQLGAAIGFSVLLIFLTLLIQFGSVWEPLVILISVPLGFVGVLLSLFAFRSTLSLNAILGVILLNGIAVANSIILVDFMKRLYARGMEPVAAAVEAAKTRLRPILITSLTTILGMLPIALGFGEGGKILQPLGITVSGGLWVSTLLTLFIVPAIYATYLEWRRAETRILHTAAARLSSALAPLVRLGLWLRDRTRGRQEAS